MNPETKSCQNCKQNFTIEPDDFSFYEKIKVPPPTLCVDCRQRRRYAWRNEKTLYRRPCDATGKSIVSIYSPDSPYKVYGIKEWWADGWDPKEFGQDIDFTRPFFEQFKELQIKVPRIALLNKNCVNSDFCNHSNDSKDAYLCVTAFGCENILYSTNVIPLKNSSDCYKTYGKSNENLYECIDIHDGFNCQFCYKVENSLDCYYSIDLRNCSNCFLSYNLRGQSYYFMNKKYSKEEYSKKVAEFNLGSYKVRQDLYEAWVKIYFENAYHRAMLIENSTGCTGNMIANSKNAINCFDAENMEDTKNIYFTVNGLKDSYDLYHVGVNSELLYECHAIVRSSNIIGSHLSYDNTNISYCDSCHNSNELFGCVGVKKGSYMILNKQYTKEEYILLKEKIIHHMKEHGEYGEFFPPSLSPFGYNETVAQVYMPLLKEEALAQGFRWTDNLPGTFGKGTIEMENIPDEIKDVPESIVNEVLTCVRTGRNYNIVSQELAFYRQHNIPIPRIHPDERHKDRILLRPDRKLYKGVCAVSGAELQMAYPPERRPNMIVSDEVYKQEVL
jgi:hypothetical protein